MNPEFLLILSCVGYNQHNVTENGNGGGHSSDVLDDTHGSERPADLEETGGCC